MHKPTKTITLKPRSPLMGLTDIFPDGIPVREGSPSLSLKNREGDRVECWEIDLQGQRRTTKAAVEALYLGLTDRYLREAAGRGRFAIPDKDAEGCDRLISKLIAHLRLKGCMEAQGISIALGYSETLVKRLLKQLEERGLVALQNIALGRGCQRAYVVKVYWLPTQEPRLLKKVSDLLSRKGGMEPRAIARSFGFSEAIVHRLVMRLQEHGLIAMEGQKVCWQGSAREVV